METVNERDLQEQRKRAVKTAWVLAAIAALIFLAFIFSGVQGS
jgi:hypothetical protein